MLFRSEDGLLALVGELNVLDGVDVEVEAGKTVALVGATGAGKSTVAKLLLRLYDVDDGAICVDGHDVRDVRLSDLRESIGYVSQDTFLFDGSVAENIRYGQFDASMGDCQGGREGRGSPQVHP